MGFDDTTPMNIGINMERRTKNNFDITKTSSYRRSLILDYLKKILLHQHPFQLYFEVGCGFGRITKLVAKFSKYLANISL